VVPDRSAAYHVARRLRKNWTITRFSDYIAEPKADGYRALHLINRHRGRLIEVQIRTPLQDNWANIVEILSREAVPGLKFGQGPPELRKLLLDTASVFAEAEAGDFSLDAALAKTQEIRTWIGTLSEDRNES